MTYRRHSTMTTIMTTTTAMMVTLVIFVRPPLPTNLNYWAWGRIFDSGIIFFLSSMCLPFFFLSLSLSHNCSRESKSAAVMQQMPWNVKILLLLWNGDSHFVCVYCTFIAVRCPSSWMSEHQYLMKWCVYSQGYASFEDCLIALTLLKVWQRTVFT